MRPLPVEDPDRGSVSSVNPDLEIRGLWWANGYIGYDCLARNYICFDGTSRPGRNDVVDVALCRGCVRKHKESGLVDVAGSRYENV